MSEEEKNIQDPSVVGIDVEVEKEIKNNVEIVDDIERQTVEAKKIENFDTLGDNHEERLQNAISKHDIFIVSKSSCPFCIEIKNTFNRLGVEGNFIDIDNMKDGKDIHRSVIKMTDGHKTVPAVWIQGNFVGGCDATKALEASGQLAVLIQDIKVAKAKLDQERGDSIDPLFWFPTAVSNQVVRWIGAIVVVLSILGIVFREELWGQYIVVFLLVDYISRFIGGASVSIIGMMAQVLSIPFGPPNFKPGFPKQFAAFCGVTFCAVTVGCYFSGNTIPGAVVLGILTCCAAMEGFLDFCVGCLFFQFAIDFKLLPPYLYRKYANTRQETLDSWKYGNLRSDPPAPVPTVQLAGTRPLDLKYKVKTDEWTRDNFNMVKYVQISYFAIPMSLAGLSFAWKLAGPYGSGRSLTAPTAWYQTFGVLSAFIFCVLFVLYGLKTILFFNKVQKEWDCPLRGSMFGMISLTITIYSGLVYDLNDQNTEMFGRVLLWIGCIAHLVMTVIKFGEYVGRQLDDEHVHGSWLILPVGNLVSAMFCPIVPIFKDDLVSSTEIGWFFFSIGVFMWLPMFTLTYYKALVGVSKEPRLRPLLYIWVAAPAVAGLAYQILLYGQDGTIPFYKNYAFPWLAKEPLGYVSGSNLLLAPFTKIVVFLALILFFGLTWAFNPTLGFYGQDPVGFECWNYVFPSTVLACGFLLYNIIIHTVFTQTVAIILLAIATVVSGVCFLHTIHKLCRLQMFRSEDKWGPLSFMKLTHEAFRGATDRLLNECSAMDLSKPNRIFDFVATLKSFEVLHAEHSLHEDTIIFKHFNDLFPEHAKKFNDDHHDDHILFEKWNGMINVLLDGNQSEEARLDILKQFQEDIPKFATHLEEHLRGEEDHLNPVGRKMVPLSLQKQISRKVWDATPAERWEVIVPFIVENMPRAGQRIRYIRTLTWAMPERAQQIGAILYRNLDAVSWAEVSVPCPEIIPRGAPNWRRFY